MSVTMKLVSRRWGLSWHALALIAPPGFAWSEASVTRYFDRVGGIEARFNAVMRRR